MLHRNLLLSCDALELNNTNAEIFLAVIGDDLQNSGEEDDDFASMDLAEDAPGEVRASVSLIPDQDCLQIQSRIL